MMQIKDEVDIMDITEKVIEENENQVKQYDPTNPKLLEYFFGQTMKKTKGKADPSSVRTMMKNELDKISK